MTDHWVLENNALCLRWEGGHLQVENRLSGSRRAFDFPAFMIRLGDVEIPADLFVRTGVEPGQNEIAFDYRHETTGIRARVRYWIDGEDPWFRKRLTLEAPESPGAPTPERLWVDIQDSPPGPMRRVGYGVRGGPGAEEQSGLDSYAPPVPGCGYPVWAGDWFAGLEHPVGFVVPGERLELFHHPVWDDERRIESYTAVYGAAESHQAVRDAFMDYMWQIRLPRLSKPIFHLSVGWSVRYLGNREYLDSFEMNQAYAEAVSDLGLKPDSLAFDAGWFDRKTIYRHKGDDEDDSRLVAFSEDLKQKGFSLALWVTHNGPVGFDTDWIQEQGWRVGEGPGSYGSGTFVVMAQPSFEEALARRWEALVGDVGAVHLKIDWDNECATHPDFADRYPSPDHMREASVNAFNRIDRRLRAVNPDLVTRNGWWPSPWWLCLANHVWLVHSGDCEYASWPSRTQRDRALTHRDTVYYQIMRRAETPIFFDAYDNHEFVQALTNAFGDPPHTWLDNLVLAACRGTTYMPMPINPESLRADRAEHLQAMMDWMRFNADALGTKETRMVLGNPAFGEVYGFLHPSDGSAWLLLRNPSPEPQVVDLGQGYELGYAPGTIRQVYPFWQDLEGSVTILGNEVRLLKFFAGAQEDASPIPGAAFMARLCDGGCEYLFPGDRRLTGDVGPAVHPDMQIPGLSAETTCDELNDGTHRMQWYVAVPHRFERPELQVVLHGPEKVLDGVHVQAGGSRYKGVPARYAYVTQRIHRQGRSSHGSARFLPPVGPRERDDYLFTIHESGWASVTLDITGDDLDELTVEAWVTGYEAPARQAIVRETPPMPGALLPAHPCGFSRCLRIR